MRAHLAALRGVRATGRVGPGSLILSAALFGISVAHSRHGGWGGDVLILALVTPLLWRRRAPELVFTLVWLVAAVQALAVGPVFADSALLVAFYTVSVSSSVRTTVVAAAALELGILLAASWFASGADAWLRSVVALSGLATAAGVLGSNVQNRRRTLAGLRERAERLEQERERELRLATANERARIAREMHDVIAHNLSVMVALCDGAAYQVHEAPDRAGVALAQAASTGRSALAEMRQLLGVLRDPPASPVRAPQPGIAQIGELVERVRAAGVPATYTLSGEMNIVPAGMELAIYRIVQEALTNTLKHAGPGAEVSVRLACAGDTVEVEVIDTGVGSDSTAGGGTGVQGMRERALLYDGELAAGRAESGGWRVRAILHIPDGRVAAVA